MTDAPARAELPEASAETPKDIGELTSAYSLGWIAVTSGLGLLVVSVADLRARLGLDLSEPLFWLGLAILVLPIALALWSPRPTRAQRIGAVIADHAPIRSPVSLQSDQSFRRFPITRP